MNDLEWMPISTAPEGRVVMTKIDDEHGPRNETTLRRTVNLWFAPDHSMYVYYTPTHWRELTKEEREKEAGIAKKAFDAAGERYRHTLSGLSEREK